MAYQPLQIIYCQILFIRIYKIWLVNELFESKIF